MNKQNRKKPTINSFSCYMMEYKKKEEAKGRRITMQDASKEAAVNWEKMSAWERAPFEQEAKIQKAHYKVIGTKYTSQGIPIEELEAEKRAKQKAIEEMEAYIENKLQSAILTGKIDSEIFYIISCNYFCQTIQGDIFPAEIGIAKYSLKGGVEDATHLFVNPGKLPLGTSNDAQEHSTKTHQLPIPPGAKGFTSYYEVFGHILNFVSQSSGKEEFPAFFTDSNELKTTKMIIDKIVRENEEFDLNIQVYPIENLFFPLKKYTIQLKNEANGTNDRAFPSIFIAKDLIDKDKYRYSLELGCNFHDLEDRSSHCSLSKVKRWGFTISDHCVMDLRLPLIPGKHVPKECNTQINIVETLAKNEPKADFLSWTAKEGHSSSAYMSEEKEEKNPWMVERKYEDNRENRKRYYEDDYPSLTDARSMSDRSNYPRQSQYGGVKPQDSTFASYASITNGGGRGLKFDSNTSGTSRPSAGRGSSIQKYRN